MLYGGLTPKARVYSNLSPAQLVEESLKRGEAILSAEGALAASTGVRTGRSPRDKFMVDEPALKDIIWWGPVNQPLDADLFHKLLRRVLDYLGSRDLFVFDGYLGADPAHSLSVRVINEHAWQNLFSRQLLRRHSPGTPAPQHQFTVIHAPDFAADPDRDGVNSEAFIIISLAEKTALIGGTKYAGEIKKALFGVMNYLMPMQGVFPMHCAANEGPGGDTALFFGLSGTGKTTLSADPSRRLIGDDEHGWSDQGVFNFEGGCYAKCVRLSPEGEPQIWNSIRFGAVLENVAVNLQSRIPDYNDVSATENTRAAYPIDFIPDAIERGYGGHPTNLFFLSYDAFGVLPPISRLSHAMAVYHFMSGYTSKTAGTEAGMGSAPQPEFSACFAHPFLPLPPRIYANQFADRLRKHDAKVWLVNTGLVGGAYGAGHRMPLPSTRAMVGAAIAGDLDSVPMTQDPVFGFEVPQRCPGVPDHLLLPREAWSDTAAYDRVAHELADAFRANFARVGHDHPELAETVGPLYGR